ncbi:MAG: (2Fe-2S)-binding protein [Lentihominibacter sp.]
MNKKIISFILNGEPVEEVVEDNMSLLDFIRDRLGLTGTKKGCEEGECGACTVMLDGRPINSCMALAREVEDRELTTIEGIAHNGELSVIQQKFIEKWALQCGYCTPGMIMSATALLNVNPDPTEEEIRVAIEGNLCRCTGYAKIVEAISEAAQVLREVK